MLTLFKNLAECAGNRRHITECNGFSSVPQRMVCDISVTVR